MQVDQVRREHVNAEQLTEDLRFFARGFRQPLRGVVHDCAQAIAVRLDLLDECENSDLIAEIGLQSDGAALTQP